VAKAALRLAVRQREDAQRQYGHVLQLVERLERKGVPSAA
jgi:hypothetical protein